MKICSTILELQNELKSAKKTVGFVPTMGYLHDGHISLVNEARKQNQTVVVSIFVNPTQFGANEDLSSYPKDLQRDFKLLQDAKVDFVFVPSVDEIYPNGACTFVEVDSNLTKTLCAKSRPTHFRGVTTVVAKLFNIIDPDFAYFGQKDAQQVAVIKQMVRDLNFRVKIRVGQIIRQENGLAMSSRNSYLNKEQEDEALVLYKSLKQAKKLIQDGERSAQTIKNSIEKTIKLSKNAQIDYIQIVDSLTLQDLELLKDEILIALAVKFGNVRLIDNLLMEIK